MHLDPTTLHLGQMAHAWQLLCTPPMADDWPAEMAALGAKVTTLNWDGTIAEGSAVARFDGAFITSEAFSLIYQDRENGMNQLFALYNALTELVLAGRVGWVHLCASGLDVPFFFVPSS